MALTAVAGPIANILMAMVFLLFENIFSLFSPYVIVKAFILFFRFAATINVGLAVFNLIPIPPLDGSRILQLLIPDKYYYKFMRYERYIIIVVFVLIFLGVLDKPAGISRKRIVLRTRLRNRISVQSIIKIKDVKMDQISYKLERCSRGLWTCF